MGMIEETKRLLRRRQLARDYIETFSTDHGKRVLADILNRAGVTRPQFHSDPGVTQFNEGHRHLAFSIFRQVHSSLDQLPDFIAEETKRLIQEQHEST